MNASLQCLSNIGTLSNNILKRYGTFNINTQQLSFAYSSLLFELICTNKKTVCPKIFKNLIGELNPLFANNQASDAKDLILFIIERLHNELKVQNNQQEVKVQYNPYQQEIESQNENLTLQKFLKDYQSNNKSIISDTFYGIMKSEMICTGCNRKKYSYQIFNMFNFILKKVKNDKLENIGDEYYDGLYLLDAFDSDKKKENLIGENMIHCNFCGGLRNGSHQQTIYGLPSVLIIILNRGKNNVDFDEEFHFAEKLDLTSYVINENSYKQFYLCGVITHLGESGSSGHFISYCRCNPNDKFLCYNDTSVFEVNVEDAMKTKISNNIYEKKTPYILFYHHL